MSRRQTRPWGGIPGALSWALLSLGPGACGTDTNVSVRFTSGTVSETAQCRGSRGEFPLRQADGLEVIIIVTNETTIVRANFTPATCGDIVAGTQASVRGSNQSGRIQATEIELGS